MAKLPEMKDLTLLEVDKALEAKQKLEGPRHYLGMSEIGHECWRYNFLSFRNASVREISASGIKAIQDGFLQEDIMAERLRMLPYIQLHTVDPSNTEEQIGFELLLGHFKGHCDGMVFGIKEAPKTWHVWENKATNETKFKKLIKLRDENEKTALQEWDEIYFAQAIIYMHCSKTERHYLTVQTPGGRAYASCRTNYNVKIADGIIEKARSIIFDNDHLPSRLSDKREFYKCKWCHHQGICHDGDFPLVHCKTCRYSEPVDGGKRKCLHKDEAIDDSKLHVDSCTYHIYNPALISAKLIEQQKDCCLYETETGFKFANCIVSGLPELKDEIDYIGTSQDLLKKIRSVNNFSKSSVEVQKAFDGEISVKSEEKAWDKQKFDERLKDV